ncbi:MAG: hypothetical protein JWO71_762 [Candidatus Acidoferrum typicum]|nr:hypothetical protein [Candidatus Acidoferrum typicum]
MTGIVSALGLPLQDCQPPPNNGFWLDASGACRTCSTNWVRIGQEDQCINNNEAGGWSINVSVPSDTEVVLQDPIPNLVTGSAVKSSSQLQSLLASGRAVAGVAADGVTQVVVRIQGTNIAGHSFMVALLNDQGTQSTAPNEDGALGSPGDTNFSQSQVTVTAGSADINGVAYAFAVYRAPKDFARPTGNGGFKSGVCNLNTRTDDLLQCRSVSLKVQDITSGNPVTVATAPVTIARPPVTLIHGMWDSSSAWDNFFPLVTGPNTADLRFRLIRANYDGIIGNLITASDPPYPQRVLLRAQRNSLGFTWNASSVLSQIKAGIEDFKGGNNPIGISVAAVQSDIVAHSMGGVIARTAALQPGFLNDNLNPSFGQGYIHKLVTIDSPHLGSPLATQLLTPQESGGCLQLLLANRQKFVFNTVTLNGAGTVSGAVADLVDAPMSPALSNIANNSPHPLPTSLIAGIYTDWPGLDSSGTAWAIRHWPLGCPSDPLAQRLTSTGWQQLFNNQPNDAIVSESSELNNLIPSPGSQFLGNVHSPGTESLGFSAPSVMDAGNVPNQVIFLLNTPVTSTVYFNQLNP